MSEFLGMKLKITLNSGSKIIGWVKSIDEQNQIIILEDAIVNNNQIPRYQLLGNAVQDIQIMSKQPNKSVKQKSESLRSGDSSPRSKVKQIKQRTTEFDILNDPAIVSVNKHQIAETPISYDKNKRSNSRKKWDDIDYNVDFDFEENLKKFNKKEIFKEFKEHDNTDERDLLVSLNKRQYQQGQPKLKYDEHVMPDYKLRRDLGLEDESVDEYDINSDYKDDEDRPEDIDVEDSNPLRHKFLTSNGTFLNSVNRQQFLQAELLVEKECPGYGDILVETGGSNLSSILISFLGGPRRFSKSNRNLPPTVIFFVGNNRSGATCLSAARHLLNKGAQVFVFLSTAKHSTLSDLFEHKRVPEDENDMSLIRTVLQQKRLFLFTSQNENEPFHPDYSSLLSTEIHDLPSPSKRTADIIVDGLFGIYGNEDINDHDLKTMHNCIVYMEKCKTPIFSIDCPSGVHCETGKILDPKYRVIPKFTVCLGAPLTGLLTAQVTGELFLCDIGFPHWIWKKVGVAFPHTPEPFEDKKFVTMEYHYQEENEELEEDQ